MPGDTADLRADTCTRFGAALGPSIAARRCFGDLKLRGSAGPASRVPTFTELYCRDPNHLLDEEYGKIVGVAMHGRSARLEIAWRK